MIVGINTIHSLEGPISPLRQGLAAQADTYLIRVLRALKALKHNVEFVIFTHTDNHDLFAACDRERIEAPRSGFSLRNHPVAHAAKARNVDVLLSPLIAPLAKTPMPQRLYAVDVYPFETDRECPKPQLIRKAVADAQGLIVPSEYLKRRCLDLFGAPLNKTTVALPGVRSGFGTLEEGSFIEPPYLTGIETVYGERGRAFLKKAHQDEEAGLEMTLTWVGPEPPGHVDSSREIRIESCPPALMSRLYHHAGVCIYPAEFDGCAMDFMEALCGSGNIVAPRSGAIPEFGGEVPFYYNPDNKGSLLQAIRHALSLEGPEREAKQRIGRESMQQYTWEKTAWKFLSGIRNR